MSNLKYLLLMALISFSIQDDNCLINFEECYFEEEIPKTSSSIENCIDSYTYSGQEFCYKCKTGYALSYNMDQCKIFENCKYLESDDKKCESCEDGYALSYDQTQCIKFENCEKLEQGDKKCEECYYNFYPDKNGKCERTLCTDYDENYVCTSCYDGYYLDETTKQCNKITIPYCLELDETNTAKCKRCVEIISPDEEGKCNLPKKLIPGCIEYNNQGECTDCDDDSYQLSGKSCKIINSCKKKIKYCYLCNAGYYYEEDDDICIGYDGSKDYSIRIKVEYSLLILALALLI